jgi:hypothetical protein
VAQRAELIGSALPKPPPRRKQGHERVKKVVPSAAAWASVKAGPRDAWLQETAPRRPWTWAKRTRQFRAFIPNAECKALCQTLEHWGVSPNDVEPLLGLVRRIVLSNAVHRAQMKAAKWAAGTARDPHYKHTREEPGALRPILNIVERVIAELEQVIQWTFTPPASLEELDPRHKPTGRTVRVARLDETIRSACAKARSEVVGIRRHLRRDTQRLRGRKATLVWPHEAQSITLRAARRRDLAQMVCRQILALYPAQTRVPRAAKAQAARVARDIIACLPVLK